MAEEEAVEEASQPMLYRNHALGFNMVSEARVLAASLCTFDARTRAVPRGKRGIMAEECRRKKKQTPQTHIHHNHNQS